MSLICLHSGLTASPAFRLFALREEFLGRLLGFLGTQLSILLVDPPFMAEWIDDLSVTCAPEHVLHRHQHARAARDSALDNRVRIVSLQRDAHACATKRLRRLATPAFARAEFVADKQLVTV